MKRIEKMSSDGDGWAMIHDWSGVQFVMVVVERAVPALAGFFLVDYSLFGYF